MWQSDFDIIRGIIRKELEPVLAALSILVRESWNKALREDEKLRLSAWKAVEEQVKALGCDFPTLH